MPIDQIIEFELRGLGPPGLTCTPLIDYFHDKTKNLLRKTFEGIIIYC